MKNPRDNIFDSYYETIKKSFEENRSQIKLINFGTGTGKTHMLFQSVYEVIKKYPEFQIIGIYVAPLREHLNISSSFKDKYPEVPVYTIKSIEMKTAHDHLNSYKKWIPSIRRDKEVWKNIPNQYSEKVQENQKNLDKVGSIINRIEFLKKMDLGDEKLTQDQINYAEREVNNLIEKFLEFFIKCKPDEKTWHDNCFKLIEIFYPLYLLREKSGILLLTYDKFNTSVPCFKFNGNTWGKRDIRLDKYVIEQTSDFKKFILAFDEQEDGYQIILKHMIDIISPQTLAINNALSSINREFSLLFSSKREENKELLNVIQDNPEICQELEEHFEKNKPISQKMKRFAKIYQRLTSEEGNSLNFLREVAKINKGFKDSLEEISNIFEQYQEDKPIIFDFEILYKVLSKFENNRTLLIPNDTYQKIGHDLMNIFSFNNLYIYNIEPLKKLFLMRRSSGHVSITEEGMSDDTSLAELIYMIFAVRLKIKDIKEFLANVLHAEDSQSRSLDIWSKEVSKVQKASEKDMAQIRKYNYLESSYVYEGYKSVTNIKEISRYQHPENNMINHELREVSIGSTSILTSPEKIIKSIADMHGNVIFLISATGGISEDLTTSFDMTYLEDKLRDDSGRSSFNAMTHEEIELCKEIRKYRQATRQIMVNFFNDDSYPNVKTQELSEHFEKRILSNFINSLTSDYGWFGIYKIQELKNFIRFLFYLFEDDSIHETFAFTQTIQWIKRFSRYCEKINNMNYSFKASADHPDIYRVQLKHKKYQSNVRVKLILYDSSFNNRYLKDNKTVQRTYQDELCEEENQKIFFISAYQSASKGLNPIIKDRNSGEKDFDSLVLLMDHYYTVMKRKKSKNETENEKSEVICQFALMKNIVASGDSIEIKNFNRYLNEPEAREFRDNQHQILLGKGILQSVGRTERRDFPNQIVKIFINEETRKNLASFYNYLDREEPDEIHKLSVNNYKVYERVLEEEEKQRILDYEDHVYNEKEAFLTMHKFREQMLTEIQHFHNDKSAFAITKAWDALRYPLVFKDTQAYLVKLKETGLFSDEFVNSLFYYTEKEFTPYLTSEEEDGKRFQIISDSINGNKKYAYHERLYPEFLKAIDREFDSEEKVLPLSPSTEQICNLYMRLIPEPEIFKKYIPRYHFFYDMLYPSLAEHFVERWIEDIIFSESDYGFKRLANFRKYNKLYEKFDLYYIKGNELFCIDVKAWSKISGNRLSKEIVKKTQDKIDAIVSDYPEFKKVRGLLLNLHSAKEKNNRHSQVLFSGSLIFFDDQHFPIESNVLRNFLFSKE